MFRRGCFYSFNWLFYTPVPKRHHGGPADSRLCCRGRTSWEGVGRGGGAGGRILSRIFLSLAIWFPVRSREISLPVCVTGNRINTRRCHQGGAAARKFRRGLALFALPMIHDGSAFIYVLCFLFASFLRIADDSWFRTRVDKDAAVCPRFSGRAGVVTREGHK